MGRCQVLRERTALLIRVSNLHASYCIVLSNTAVFLSVALLMEHYVWYALRNRETFRHEKAWVHFASTQYHDTWMKRLQCLNFRFFEGTLKC